MVFGMIRVIVVCLFYEIIMFLDRILKLFGMKKEYIVVLNYFMFYFLNCIWFIFIKYLYDRVVLLYVLVVLGVVGLMLGYWVRFNINFLIVEIILLKILKNVYYEIVVLFKFYF